MIQIFPAVAPSTIFGAAGKEARHTVYAKEKMVTGRYCCCCCCRAPGKKIRLIKKTNRQEMPDAMGFKNSKDFLVLHLQSDQG
jgi:hypothetical protein